MIAKAASSRLSWPSCPDPKSKNRDDAGEKRPKPPYDVPPVGITNSSSAESLRRLQPSTTR
jgi:hypothetical protein